MALHPQDGALTGRLRVSAETYLAYGALCWPGAKHFLLLGVDSDECLTGEAEIVCRTCVRDAARVMLLRLDEIATNSCPQKLPYLDLPGESSPDDAQCALCGEAV